MTDDVLTPLIDAGTIATRVRELGGDITNATAGHPLTVLAVMTGGLVFAADLIRAIERPLQLGVLHARSYRGRATRAGDLELALDQLPELADRYVLVVDDIFDSGQTLTRIAEELASRGARRVEAAVLLRKDVARERDVRDPAYVGFEIADEFVVGYGLDFDGEYRGRPEISVLRPAAPPA